MPPLKDSCSHLLQNSFLYPLPNIAMLKMFLHRNNLFQTPQKIVFKSFTQKTAFFSPKIILIWTQVNKSPIHENRYEKSVSGKNPSNYNSTLWNMAEIVSKNWEEAGGEGVVNLL